MDPVDAKRLARLFNAYARQFPDRIVGLFPRRGGALRKFHRWADGRPSLGAWLVSVPEAPGRLWMALVDWKKRDNFYLVLFPESRVGPIAELHRARRRPDGLSLAWRYRPSLRDGRNPDRCASFVRAHGSCEVEIQLPDLLDSMDAFLGDLAWLAAARTAADALQRGLPMPSTIFPEGRQFERRHLVRERDTAAVRLLKQQALEAGQLRCACCEFDFAAAYGAVGYGFIEVHHTVPVSELPVQGGHTRVEDLALLCANCHRMLHRRRPWLGLDQLRELLRHGPIHHPAVAPRKGQVSHR